MPVDIERTLINAGFYNSSYSRGQQKSIPQERCVDVLFSEVWSVALYLHKYLIHEIEGEFSINGIQNYPVAEVYRFVTKNFGRRIQKVNENGEDRFDFIKLKCPGMSYLNMPK